MAALTEHTILPLPAFEAPVKLLIVVSSYYRAIADDLIAGARATAERAGAAVDLVEVPGAQHRVDAGDRPLGHQRAVGHLVDPRLPVHNVAQDRGQQRLVRLGRGAFGVIGGDAPIQELGQHPVGRLVRGFHLKQRLNGIDAGCAAAGALVGPGRVA